MLQDTQPDEPKSLIEEKLKKAMTEKAPVSDGQTTGGASRSARSAAASIRDIPMTGVMPPILRESGMTPAEWEMLRQSANPAVGGGAAAAAGVLTAVDEDAEGDEEATVPSEFEYFTDGDEEEEL